MKPCGLLLHVTLFIVSGTSLDTTPKRLIIAYIGDTDDNDGNHNLGNLGYRFSDLAQFSDKISSIGRDNGEFQVLSPHTESCECGKKSFEPDTEIEQDVSPNQAIYQEIISDNQNPAQVEAMPNNVITKYPWQSNSLSPDMQEFYNYHWQSDTYKNKKGASDVYKHHTCQIGLPTSDARVEEDNTRSGWSGGFQSGLGKEMGTGVESDAINGGMLDNIYSCFPNCMYGTKSDKGDLGGFNGDLPVVPGNLLNMGPMGHLEGVSNIIDQSNEGIVIDQMQSNTVGSLQSGVQSKVGGGFGEQFVSKKNKAGTITGGVQSNVASGWQGGKGGTWNGGGITKWQNNKGGEGGQISMQSQSTGGSIINVEGQSSTGGLWQSGEKEHVKIQEQGVASGAWQGGGKGQIKTHEQGGAGGVWHSDGESQLNMAAQKSAGGVWQSGEAGLINMGSQASGGGMGIWKGAGESQINVEGQNGGGGVWKTGGGGLWEGGEANQFKVQSQGSKGGLWQGGGGGIWHGSGENQMNVKNQGGAGGLWYGSGENQLNVKNQGGAGGLWYGSGENQLNVKNQGGTGGIWHGSGENKMNVKNQGGAGGLWYGSGENQMNVKNQGGAGGLWYGSGENQMNVKNQGGGGGLWQGGGGGAWQSGGGGLWQEGGGLWQGGGASNIKMQEQAGGGAFWQGGEGGLWQNAGRDYMNMEGRGGQEHINMGQFDGAWKGGGPQSSFQIPGQFDGKWQGPGDGLFDGKWKSGGGLFGGPRFDGRWNPSNRVKYGPMMYGEGVPGFGSGGFNTVGSVESGGESDVPAGGGSGGHSGKGISNGPSGVSSTNGVTSAGPGFNYGFNGVPPVPGLAPINNLGPRTELSSPLGGFVGPGFGGMDGFGGFGPGAGFAPGAGFGPGSGFDGFSGPGSNGGTGGYETGPGG